MSFALVFPGQGSQFPGMLDSYGGHPQVALTLAEASDTLSVDLTAMAREGRLGDDLNRTENTQPAMLAMGVGVCLALFGELLGKGVCPDALAGHSLGEYAALVCADAMDFPEAVRAVRLRGEAMTRVTPPGKGAMCAVMGLSPKVADESCAELRQDGCKVWAANYNSPLQVVLAGESDSVARASEELKLKGAKKIAPLPMSAPSHCPLMKPAADELAEFLKGIEFRAPRIPVLHNKTAAAAEGGDAIPWLLREQVVSPVRWIETVQNLSGRGIEKLAECGPGRALTGLGRRIVSDAEHLPLDSSAAISEFARSVT